MNADGSGKICSIRLALQTEQRLIVTDDVDGHLFYVAQGLVLLEARVGSDQRRVLDILFEGDAFPTCEARGLPEAVLVAARATELMRYRPAGIDRIGRLDPELGARMHRALGNRNARRTLHVATLGETSADARLADFLVEAGLALSEPAIGTPVRGFDLPLTREQIASYLALNPDTLSRVFTRFRQRGIIETNGRHIDIRDWGGLCQSSPMSKSLCDLAARATAQLPQAACRTEKFSQASHGI